MKFCYASSSAVVLLLAWSIARLPAATDVYLTGVPDYAWHAGCFGTASGNLIGFWDRHGLPNLYTGPTAGGVAPLNDSGSNSGIRSLWASAAGRDGRPADQPGHLDDYYAPYERSSEQSVYESTEPDPYLVAGRPEHAPDCIGDFIGLNQNKWTNLNGECDGNINAYSFVYWDASGERRINYTPGPEAGLPATDIPSGLRAFTAWRGYSGNVFSQLADFNPQVSAGNGFSFEDLKAEIDAGYPVLLFLQYFDVPSRSLSGMPRANPLIHGMLAYGYLIADDGRQRVRFRTSWASGDLQFNEWTSTWFVAQDLPVRGVIGYHPLPQITSVERQNGGVLLTWHGPSAKVFDAVSRSTRSAHWYVVERSSSLDANSFAPISEPTDGQAATIPDCCDGTVFFRLRLVPPPEL